MMYVMRLQNMLFANGSVRQTIFKNTFWQFVGTFGNKLLSLFLIVYAARILGAEGYGQFTFALAFVSLFVVLSHLGLPNIITREFARQENKNEFYAILSLEIVLILATIISIAVVSFLTVDSPEVRMLIFVLGGFLLLNSFIGTAYSYFHSQQRMEYEAGIELVQMLLLVSLGLFVLSQFPSPVNLSYAYAISAVIAFLVTIGVFSIKMFPVRLRWDVAVWKKYLSMSWPLALSAVFAILYSYMDSVMLGYWNLFAETGWYNAAQRVMLASLLPMGFVAASFYPALSKFSSESKERFQRAWNHEIEAMIVLALPLAVGGIVLASRIVSFLYSAEFAAATFALQILLMTAAVNFLYRPFYDAMIVLNHEREVFKVTILGAVLNIALNFFLIPHYSLYGAAAATLVTYSLLLFMGMIFVKKFTYIQIPIGRIGLTTLAAVFSAYVMYIVLRYLLEGQLHVLVLILVGAAVYGAIFFGLWKFVVTKYFKHVYA